MSAGDAALVLASGLATGLGGLALLALRRPGDRLLDGLLGFTAGVMLAAAAFSLLVPALERGGLLEVVAGFAVGAAAIAALDELTPHLHGRFSERGHGTPAQLAAGQRALLLLSALTIHNVPEGLAVGLAFAAGGTELGAPLAIAIGIQNVPEGFAAGAPLIRAGTTPGRAAAVALATGVVEPVAAAVAFGAFEAVDALLPAGLGFAAGAMIYVVIDELVPEGQGRGNERVATFGALAGFALLLALDNAFG